MFEKISHIGFATKDIKIAIKACEKILDLKLKEIKTIGTNKIAFIPVGNDEIELIQPSPSSRIYQFLEEKGEGVHHIAFETNDIEDAIATLKEKGAKILDEKPFIGAHEVNIAFFTLPGIENIAFELVERELPEDKT